MHSGYSKETLYRIGNENYKALNLLCTGLFDAGYWETPEKVIHRGIEDMLAFYVQAVALSLQLTCNMPDGNMDFILSVTKKDLLGIRESSVSESEMKDTVQKLVNSPPILLQLCNLYDREKKDCITARFLDSLFNILLALTDICQARNKETASFLMAYYKKTSVFFNGGAADLYRIGEREVFRKINSEEFHSTPLYLQTSERRAGETVSHRRKENTPEHSEASRLEEPEEQSDRDREQSVREGERKTEEKAEKDRDGLQELIAQLNDLIGLETVKGEINSLINLIKVKKIREEYGMPSMNISYHMVYTGNPGTGKTTVARLMAGIYKELGILSKGNLVETDRSGLVAGYVGQTALKVKEVVEEALGGVLFIDEAYALAGENLPGDFGKEAVDALVKLMEDNRDNLVVIVAGYTEEMKNFLKSNSGLISRFNRFIEFPDYTTEELVSILSLMSDKAGLTIAEEAKGHIRELLTGMDHEKKKEFGNARGIRNIFEKILINQANRLAACERPTKEEVSFISLPDVSDI